MQFNKSSREVSDILLNRFKNVSLVDGNLNEWWILHKVEPTTICSKEDQEFFKCEMCKSYNRQSIHRTHYSEAFDDSAGFRTGVEASFNKFGKRLSDSSSSKTPNKRFSLDIDTKQATDLSKCYIGKKMKKVIRFSNELEFINISNTFITFQTSLHSTFHHLD